VAAAQFDFSRSRLDRMVQPLRPAYLQVGGSESDKVYCAMADAPPAGPPPGFESVLTRERWDDVLISLLLSRSECGEEDGVRVGRCFALIRLLSRARHTSLGLFGIVAHIVTAGGYYKLGAR
jgi:hypothetical protein